MNNTLIYISVLFIYLLILLFVGIISAKKTKNTADFFIGGRKMGAWVTAFSFVAAYFSSVLIIGGGGFGFMFGMSTLWIGAINVLVGCLLCWIILGPKIRQLTRKLQVMTIPGFLGKRYDSKFSLLFSAVVILLFMIIYNVSMLKGMGHAFEVLMNIPYIYGVLISSIIILFYVSLGGYFAVIWTSFIQAWIMGISLILLTMFSLKAAGGLTAANKALEAMNSGLITTPGVWGWGGLISYSLIVSFGVWGMPQLLIRFYSIKNVNVLRLGTVLVTLGGSMALLPYLNGAIARVLCPQISNPDLAIPTLTKTVLSPFGSAVFLAGVAAAGMSTFASVLIILSSTMVQDIIKEGFKKNLEEHETLSISKIVSAIIGIISIIIALKPPALVLTLTAFSWAVISSTTLWPILFGIYSKSVTKTGCIVSMAGGFLTSIIWMAFKNPFKIHGFIPGILVGLLLIVIVSMFTKKFEKEHLAKIFE